MKSPSNGADEGTPSRGAPRLRTLGSAVLERDGVEVLAGRTKLLLLLTYVAAAGGRPVPREQLAALLWGDRPEAKARASLREALSRLRSALGETMEVDRATVRIPPDRLAFDAREIEECVRAGLLEQAVGLYGGEFLPGAESGAIDVFRSWVEGERARLRSLHRTALEQLAGDAERRADWRATVEWAEYWAEAAPLSEQAHRTLFRGLAMAGRVPEAEAMWAAFSAAARTGLGSEPAPPPLPAEPAAPAPVRRRVGAAAVFSPDLVGRDAAFGTLVEAWDEARRGTGRGLLVRGEAGLGKSRLLRELSTWLEARDEDALVLRATAHPAERSAPLSLARLLLSPLRLARGLSGAGDGALAELATLVPEIRERFPSLPPAREDPDVLADSLRRVLEDVAIELPVLLLVDDLHRADDQSLHLLAAIARHPPPRTLFLTTAAATELADRRLEVASGLDTLSLSPLSEAEVGAMVASMIELEPGDQATLARVVHAASGGSPFVAAEQVATLVEEGHVRAGDDGVWRIETDLDPERIPVPATVAEATARRLTRLAEPLRDLLAHAALLWPDRDPDLLAALSGSSRDEVEERLDALLARRVLRPAPDGGYEFAHDVLRKVAYETIPPHRRAALHDDVARVLRQRGLPTGRAQEAAERHRERAGEGLLRRRSRRLVGGWAAVALLLLAATLIGWIGSRDGALPLPESAPVLAVGTVETRSEAPDGSAGAAVRDMLGTGLAQLPGVRVIGGPRLVELMQVVELETGAPSCASAAARRAGAQQLLDGSLYHRPDGMWRLDLRRVDLATGVVRGAGTVEARSLDRLARLAVAGIARELGLDTSLPAFSDGSTPSAVALALYEEGLRTYYRGDLLPARERFEAALDEDPGFAMAAYYAGLAAWHSDAPAALRHLQRARDLSGNGPDRERLLIRGAWADLLDEPAVVAYAESLMARFPDEPMGYQLRGRSLARAGSFLDAAAFFEQVLEMGAIAPGPNSSPRHGAVAADLASAYAMADSLATAERIVRSWIDRSPGSALAWMRLRDILEHQERFDEALAAADVARRLHDAPDAYDVNYPALIQLKREDFAPADSALGRTLRTGTSEEARQARWFRLISRRWQGRLDEALDDALALRRGATTTPVEGFPPYDALAQAQVLFEMGRHRAAAALFDSLATTFATGASEGHSAHQRTWMLTHAADALAAARDTAALTLLADSLEHLGRQSSQGRDWILHHHVRGLLAMARGDLPVAERELRQALFSTRAGFTRTNYLLARVLLDRGAPGEAIETLQPVFRAPVDVSNFYLSRTHVRALIGEAWLAAGRPDSALHHLHRARQAWDNADTNLLPQRARVDSLIHRAQKKLPPAAPSPFPR